MGGLITLVANPANIIAAFVAVAVFSTCITLAAPAFKTDKLDARLKSTTAERPERSRGG